MVNWHNPALLLKDYFALINLNHAMAGLYIWETVATAGFEFDVLRRKRKYTWTIWLYLGTRYTLLLAYVFLFIVIDGPGVSCQPFMITTIALPYVSWAFASFIIIIRIMAIWNRNIIVLLIAVGVWSGGFALHVRNLTMVDTTHNPIVDACIILHTRRGLPNALGVLVADVVLLVTMLIGLLRQAHKHSTGVWKLLYQQCIIWLALAFFAEIPPVVFLILNLNEVWNQMLCAPAITILSIGAARMYRSLSDRGCLTKYVLSDPPQFSSGSSIPHVPRRSPNNAYDSFQFVSVTRSDITQTTYYDASASPAPDQIPLELVPCGSTTSSLAYENTNNRADSARYETV